MKVIYSSKELVKLMLAKGAKEKWTMPRMLAHFKITGASFSRMKAGRQTPGIDTYIRLCTKLGLPLSVEKKSQKIIPPEVGKLPRKPMKKA